MAWLGVALTVAMDFDDRAINHGVLHVRVVRDRLKAPCENITFDPVTEAFEDGVPVAKDLG